MDTDAVPEAPPTPAPAPTPAAPSGEAGVRPDPASGAYPALLQAQKKRKPLGLMMLGALGIVFGDIGTSPLYTLRECIHLLAPQNEAQLRADVLHLLSLIFWSLMVVVTIKYLL